MRKGIVLPILGVVAGVGLLALVVALTLSGEVGPGPPPVPAEGEDHQLHGLDPEPVPDAERPETELAEPDAAPDPRPDVAPKPKESEWKKPSEERQTWVRAPKKTDDEVRALLTKEPGLTALDLRDSKVSDSVLADIGRLEGLEVLWIRYNQRVTDEGIHHLRDLTGLRELMLGGTKLTDAGLAALEDLTKLEVLYIWRTAVTDEGLYHLRKMKSLRILYASNTTIRGTGFSHLTEVPLDKLWLVDTRVNDEGATHIGRLATLTDLRLAKSALTDAGVQGLRGLVGLETLILPSRISKPVRDALWEELPLLK
jgi:hypothetical protein